MPVNTAPTKEFMDKMKLSSKSDKMPMKKKKKMNDKGKSKSRLMNIME